MTLKSIIYERGSPPTLRVLNQLLLPHQTVYVNVGSARAAFAAIRHMLVRGAPAIALVAVLAVAVEDPFSIELPETNGTTQTKDNSKQKPPEQNSSHKSQSSARHDADFEELISTISVLLQGPLSKDATPAEAAHWYRTRLTYLEVSRPTAVNLADAVRKLVKALEQAAKTATSAAEIRDTYVQAAEAMLISDVADNEAIGREGCEWLRTHCGLSQSKKGSVLTHCNTGSLATAGYGTALGVVRSLHSAGVLRQAFYTETRPYNQGSRLTGYELLYDGIPATLVTDSMAAALFRLKAAPHRENIVAVVVGADRVAANGDTANKIGTYALACLARWHGVKFLVAAPRTTVDLGTKTGEGIVIEERPPPEILSVKGPRVVGYEEGRQTIEGYEKGMQRVDLDTVETVSTAALGTRAWNPAFDVTPADLIDGIVTEVGVAEKVDGRFDLEGLFKLERKG